ncbi:(2Fe-2S) ferredoxin domain-containing protein [Petroclostridium sp. X23]|uniref:(2Fe-2S) ferredoxin domain-containing protein n=1 Tax=Petroclostridium sp. X23 TaxID=3045146 RepID=UPI0024AE23FF|nr:(2Fe-2S) ferredoxin domain-containing protein [Petroclostridium sp. X23]WHH57347.1 (2Fe-2S) ferredoxin domain-containing protein [Petroclostridium sp. X23]
MVTIHVCIGSACHIKGAYNIINGFQTMIEDQNAGDKVTVKAAFCLGECTKAVSVKVNEGSVYSVAEKNINQFFEEHVRPLL